MYDVSGACRAHAPLVTYLIRSAGTPLPCPYAAKYSDALEIRCAYTPEDKARVREALKEANADLEKCVENADVKGASWSAYVVAALRNKQGAQAVGHGILNDVLLNSPQYYSSQFVKESPPTQSQLAYLGGYEFKQYANPVETYNTKWGIESYNILNLGMDVAKASGKIPKIVYEAGKYFLETAAGKTSDFYTDDSIHSSY